MGKIFKVAHSKREYFEGDHRFEHWYVDNQVYFITTKCNQSFHAFVTPESQTIFWDRFYHYASEYEFFPWITTLMSNHYHTLGYLRHGKNLGQLMRKFHGSVAKLVNDILPERQLPFWRERGGRDYFDGCLRDEVQCRRAYWYVYRQCIRHGIATDPCQFPNTKIDIELERGLARAMELKALLYDVPYPRYFKDR